MTLIPLAATRRAVVASAAALATTAAWGGGRSAAAGPADPRTPMKGLAMGTITTADGAQIFYKEWGSGRPVVFSHGWPLNADVWDEQMYAFASAGFRAIAHDRRGHGRSSQTWNGNDMDTYADDLAALVKALDLKDVVHVGHSTGGGEVARYIGRHGTSRVRGAVLISAITPTLMQSPNNPAGPPRAVFDDIRQKVMADRGQYYHELAEPFFGANRPGSHVSLGTKDAFWRQCMFAGLRGAYDCIQVFSETEFTQDLKRFDKPTLIIHGEDDQICPFDTTGRAAARLVNGATLKVYPGAPHGLYVTHRETLSADLLAFAKA